MDCFNKSKVLRDASAHFLYSFLLFDFYCLLFLMTSPSKVHLNHLFPRFNCSNKISSISLCSAAGCTFPRRGGQGTWICTIEMWCFYYEIALFLCFVTFFFFTFFLHSIPKTMMNVSIGRWSFLANWRSEWGRFWWWNSRWNKKWEMVLL